MASHEDMYPRCILCHKIVGKVQTLRFPKVSRPKYDHFAKERCNYGTYISRFYGENNAFLKRTRLFYAEYFCDYSELQKFSNLNKNKITDFLQSRSTYKAKCCFKSVKISKKQDFFQITRTHSYFYPVMNIS